MSSIKVLGGNILVKSEEQSFKTASGIIMPHAARVFTQKGTVVSVGGGSDECPMTIEVGDTVHFIKRAGQEMTIDEVKYRMMHVDEVLCIEQQNV